MSQELTLPLPTKETLLPDLQKAESSYIEILDTLALHHLTAPDSDPALATPLYRKILALQRLNGEKESTRDLYNMAISLNRQKTLACYQEAKLILEDVVPRLVWRQRMDKDAEQVFLQQEVGAMRELLIAMEGCGMSGEGGREEVEYVARRAANAVRSLGEKEGHVRGLCEGSVVFKGIWEETGGKAETAETESKVV